MQLVSIYSSIKFLSLLNLNSKIISYIYILLARQNLTLNVRADMPSCNLAETIHNAWPQQSENNICCLYAATVDDMMRVFM